MLTDLYLALLEYKIIKQFFGQKSDLMSDSGILNYK